MEVRRERALGHGARPWKRRRSIEFGLIVVLALVLGLSGGYQCWGLQRHTLAPGDTSVAAPSAEATSAAATPSPAGAPVPHSPATAATPAPLHEPPKAAGTHAPAPALPPPVGMDQTHAPPGAHDAGGHGAAEGHGEAHGPALPEISPIPGVTFVETMISLMEHELKGRFLGWRPNDIIIGKFTDNINNYQLGVLEALRFTMLRLKDSLTRMGDADTYDPDLEKAQHLLMNSATLFWFPSAENSYQEAVDHLKSFLNKLKTGKRSFYYRKDNLVALINSYRDLLGNVNRYLIVGGISWFQADDYFYYAKGVAHVYYEILRVVRVGFQPQLATTLYGIDIMDEMLHELHTAEQIDPWIILDSNLGGFFANHRANLNAPLSEVAHLMVVMGQL